MCKIKPCAALTRAPIFTVFIITFFPLLIMEKKHAERDQTVPKQKIKLYPQKKKHNKHNIRILKRMRKRND